MRNFDDERTKKIMGFFCDILIKHNCRIIYVEGLDVAWEFTSKNRHFKKLIGRDVESYDELNFKEVKQASKLEKKWGLRWKKKALHRYLADVDGSSTEEKMKLMQSIKDNIKDDKDSELKKILNEV